MKEIFVSQITMARYDELLAMAEAMWAREMAWKVLVEGSI